MTQIFAISSNATEKLLRASAALNAAARDVDWTNFSAQQSTEIVPPSVSSPK